MYISKMKDHDVLEDYKNLTHELCVLMGFCGSIIDGKPHHVDDYLPAEGVFTAEEFADLDLSRLGKA